jgi:hypothetical protein
LRSACGRVTNAAKTTSEQPVLAKAEAGFLLPVVSLMLKRSCPKPRQRGKGWNSCASSFSPTCRDVKQIS